MSRLRHIGLLACPFVAVVCAWLSANAQLDLQGQLTIGVVVLMAGWWVTEAIPIAATALLPLVLFPLLGIGSFAEASSPYAHRLIFLFLGGFLIAVAMQRWNLHRRFALLVMRAMGDQPRRIVAGFMIVAAVLSMWISNTATTIMMLPISLSILELVERQTDDATEQRNIGLCFMLGLAYAASIGGIGTLIGTPPNALFAAFVETQYGHTISFQSWFFIGLPLVIIFLPLAWLMLTRVIYPMQLKKIPHTKTLIADELRKIGPMQRAEKTVMVVFVLTALAWIFRPTITTIVPVLSGLDDAGIAMGSAIMLFLLPSGNTEQPRLLDWQGSTLVPWGILFLFGGGLSLAEAMQRNGITEMIGLQVSGLTAIHPILLIMSIATIIIFLTEITSNTATTAALLPILAAVATGAGLHPYLLLLPATIGASCAFMMPVATPPNALVFASDRVTIPQMCRAGLWLNILAIFLVTLLIYGCAEWLLGIDMSTVPSWAQR